MWDLVPQPGIKWGSLHWELRVLVTGPPGKSQGYGFLSKVNYFLKRKKEKRGKKPN